MTTDKRRIDACLKACEGISTQNLEDNVPFLELARRYNVVLRERDALRAAVRHEADCVEAAKAEIKALRSELVDLRSSMKFRTSLIGRTEAERDTLRAKIEQMEQQEPVATIHINSITGNPSVDFIPGHRYLHHNSSLYALPGAKEQEPTRDWWDCLIADISAIDCMYRGSPTYAHDAYWMRDHVVWMLKKRRDAIPGAIDRVTGEQS